MKLDLTVIKNFDWKNLVVCRGSGIDNFDPRDWDETSSIKYVEVGLKGSIEIVHSKAKEWKAVEDGIAGNPWMIVPIRGKYYAGTYEWLREGQTVKFGRFRNLYDLYMEDKKCLADHFKVLPLNKFYPKGGEIVGFFVTTLARSRSYGANGRERSNVVWYRLPSQDGKIEGKEVAIVAVGKTPCPPKKETKPSPRPEPKPPKREEEEYIRPWNKKKSAFEKILDWLEDLF